MSRASYTSSGGAAVPAFSDNFSLRVTAVDSNAAQADAATFALALAQAESNAAPSEAVTLAFPSPDFSESSATPTDSRLLAIRSWATGCSDNDSSKTTPANANGQNDGLFAVVSTALSLGDLTNPVTLTTGALNFPSVGATSSPSLYLYFRTSAARLAATDTVTIDYNAGAGFVNAWTWGLAQEDHSAVPLVVSLPGGTNPATITLRCNYLAAQVAVPQGSVSLDAWATQANTTL